MMLRDVLLRWISILLFIAISILLIKLFIWLLPILLIVFIGYYIYQYFKEKVDDGKEVEVEKAKRHKNVKKKTKKIVIIDEKSND